MEVVLVVVGLVAVVVFIFRSISNSSSPEFDDPRSMSNHHLLAAIGGQADWLEKLMQNCAKSGFQPLSQDMKNLESERKVYIASLCLEVISRGSGSGFGSQYPGATAVTNPFADTATHAKELEARGIPATKAAMRAVKEQLLKANGYVYRASWGELG